MIADLLGNKTLEPIVAELFSRDKKLNIFLVSNTKSYFVVLKDNRWNSTNYFIKKIPNKRALFFIWISILFYSFLKNHKHSDHSKAKLQKNKINWKRYINWALK